MKDRNGIDVVEGDQVFVLPDKKSHTRGGKAQVRKIKIREDGKEEARVDDGPPGDFDILKSTEWKWSSWVTSSQFEKI